MIYKVTLNGKTYEVEVEAGEAMIVDEYEAYAPAAPAPAKRNASCTPFWNTAISIAASAVSRP